MKSNLYDNSTKDEFLPISEDALYLARTIAEKFVNVEFAVWDLKEFYSAFHNVRRNIVFIECDKMMHDDIVRLVSRDERWRSCAIYVGERKPKIINELVKAPVTVSGSGAGGGGSGSGGRFDLSSTGTIVIVHRTDFDDTTPHSVVIANATRPFWIPCLERKLVDLLAYALRGWIPVQVSEAVDAIKWSFRNRKMNSNERVFVEKELSIPIMQKYAARRYLGWFMDILLYKLSENKEFEHIDPRYIANGAIYLDALNELNEL